MKNLNCPNCGAPIEIDKNKCAYCGTSYFDISSLDLEDGKPFFLKLKKGNMIFTQKVYLKPDASCSSSCDRVYAYGGLGFSPVAQFVSNVHLTTQLNFEAIPFTCQDDKEVLMILENE